LYEYRETNSNSQFDIFFKLADRIKRLKRHMLTTVPLSQYCVISGESIKAVERRIERGYWVKGSHYFTPANVRERWVDLVAISDWARNSGSNS